MYSLSPVRAGERVQSFWLWYERREPEVSDRVSGNMLNPSFNLLLLFIA